MSDATRQKTRRQRLKEEGLVDVRLDISKTTRDKLKNIADAKKTTMKAIITECLEKEVA